MLQLAVTETLQCAQRTRAEGEAFIRDSVRLRRDTQDCLRRASLAVARSQTLLALVRQREWAQRGLDEPQPRVGAFRAWSTGGTDDVVPAREAPAPA